MCYPTQDYTIIEFMINIKVGIVGVGGILAIISYHKKTMISTALGCSRVLRTALFF